MAQATITYRNIAPDDPILKGMPDMDVPVTVSQRPTIGEDGRLKMLVEATDGKDVVWSDQYDQLQCGDPR